MGQMLTAKQVAEVKGCSYQYVKRVIKEGKIKAVESLNDKNRNVAYLVRAAELDAAFRPVFVFGNRKITIPDSSSKVSDHVLHFSFPINFRQAWEQTEEFEPMGELDVSISKGE